LGPILAGQWAAAAAGSADARATLAEFLRLHLAFLAARPEAGEALYGEPGGADGEARDASIRAALEPIRAGVRAAVERGKGEGAFAEDAEADMAALHFLGISQMSFVFWDLRGRSGSLPEIGRGLFEQWIAALGAAGEWEGPAKG
jgi:hypothetical protein